jgi:selenocysteine lyase/cysteine desulfurase
LKESIGAQTIHEKEIFINKRVLDRLLKLENLFLLGNNNLPKVSIFSFVIKSKKGKILHSNFVTQLLNDIFGIQSRAGCMCSAIYG